MSVGKGAPLPKTARLAKRKPGTRSSAPELLGASIVELATLGELGRPLPPRQPQQIPRSPQPRRSGAQSTPALTHVAFSQSTPTRPASGCARLGPPTRAKRTTGAPQSADAGPA